MSDNENPLLNRGSLGSDPVLDETATARILDNHPEIRVVVYSMRPNLINLTYQRAIEAMGDQGILFVVSAGNCQTAYCADTSRIRRRVCREEPGTSRQWCASLSRSVRYV